MSELAIVEDGGMIVRDGVIVAAGPSDEIERELPDDVEIVDAKGRIVLPGFVDAHAHPVFGGNRVDEFEMRAGARPTKRSPLEVAEFVRPCAKHAPRVKTSCSRRRKKRADWFLRCGTTTMEAKSGYWLVA